MNTTSDALLALNRTFLFNRIQNDPKTSSASQMFSCSKSLTDCWGKNPLSSNLYLKMNLLGEKVRKWGPFFEMPISTFPKKNGIVREKCLFFFSKLHQFFTPRHSNEVWLPCGPQRGDGRRSRTWGERWGRAARLWLSVSCNPLHIGHRMLSNPL